MAKITLKRGEAKIINMTVKDSDGVVVNLSEATLTLGVKALKSDTTYSLSKSDSSFDKTSATSGIVSVAVTSTDTSISEGDYIGELKCSWSSGVTINKTADFVLQIKAAVTS